MLMIMINLRSANRSGGRNTKSTKIVNKAKFAVTQSHQTRVWLN